MIRTRGWKAVTAALCVLTLTATAAACSSKDNDSSSSNAPGVTADTIKIGVGVADLDGLIAQGMALPPSLTTSKLAQRVTTYFDDWNAAGGINGRTVEPVILTWDPVKPATQEKFCADATVNNEILAVVVPSGLNSKTVQCVVDAGVPMYFGDVASQSAFDTNLLVAVAPSSEIMATAGTQGALDEGTITSSSNVAIMSNDYPEGQASAAAAKAVLDKANVKNSVVTIHTMAGDTGASNSESAAAVNTMKASGATTVLDLLTFTTGKGYWSNVAGSGLKTIKLDVASSNCTAYGAKSTPASAAGTPCFTVVGEAVTSTGTLRPETSFEKDCRAHWDKAFAADFPTGSYPGVPSGETATLSDGKVVGSDYAPQECTLTNVLKLSIEKAGKSLTRDSLLKATFSLGDVPVALASNGQGSLSSGKPYIANSDHQVVFTVAGDTAGANGLYNGCPTKTNCYVPSGTTWNTISN